MERQKGSYVLAAIALCIAVVALAVGFATFSNTATVTTNTTVTPDNDFKVELSSSSGNTTVTAVSASDSGTATGATGSGTLTAWNNGTSTINLTGNFTNIGQELTYVFYARNTGDLKAFLNGISYTGPITCSTPDGTTNPGDATMVENACKTMSLSMEVNNGTLGDSLNVAYGESSKTATLNAAHSIAATNGFDTITVKVKYNGNSKPEENYGKVDGNFNVQFGTITLNYASTDNRGQ